MSRRAQDEYAVRSQNLAEAAIARGFWTTDVTPVTLPDGTVVETDDGPRAGVTLAKVEALPPVFRPTGTVTAANCCPLNDGAIALGRPFGATGARMVTTVIHGLQERDATLGLVTLCAAGGQGMALVVERLS